MSDHTPAYLLITTDQSVNPVNNPFPSLASAQHDTEKLMPLLSEQLRARFNAENRLHTVFFCATLTRSTGRTVEQHIRTITPISEGIAFFAASSYVDGAWEKHSMSLDPETWQPLNATG